MKKIILLVTATLVLVACNNVKNDEYLISGTAKGIENGKTIILETQDESGMGLVAKDTVKVENEKFELKGKISEPTFYNIQLEGSQDKILFILENGEEVSIEVKKDSILKSKVSGTYNNDEYVQFNEKIIALQKKLTDYQTKNTPAMAAAQQAKDNATITKLGEEFGKIQKEIGDTYKVYPETHPKSFISVLILQGILNDPSTDIKKAEATFNALEKSLQTTKSGKAIKEALSKLKAMPAAAPAAIGGAK